MVIGEPKKGQRLREKLRPERCVALVIALIVVAVVMMLIMSTLYVITSSTTISGAGKRYATASEAADGAVELAKDSIGLILRKGSLPSIIPGTCVGKSYDLDYAVNNVGNPCTFSLTLPGTLGTQYDATITVEFPTAGVSYGSRIEFPPRYVAGKTGQSFYYRINTIVKNKQDNTVAENSVLYGSVE
jgi:hypothetical protein